MTETTEAGAAPAVPDTLTLTLRKPIPNVTGDDLRELNLREPTVGEMILAEKETGMAADILLVSQVAGVARSVIEKVGARDFLKAARYLASFAGNDQPAGEA